MLLASGKNATEAPAEAMQDFLEEGAGRAATLSTQCVLLPSIMWYRVSRQHFLAPA